MSKADKKSLLILLVAVVALGLWFVIGETSFIENMDSTGQTITSIGVLLAILVAIGIWKLY